MSNVPPAPASCYRMCGATSYRLVIERDAAGAMTHTGLYRCTGCSVVFADPRAWREGGEDELPPAAPVKPLTASQAPQGAPTVPEGPSFKTYCLVPDRPPTSR